MVDGQTIQNTIDNRADSVTGIGEVMIKADNDKMDALPQQQQQNDGNTSNTFNRKQSQSIAGKHSK